jgi:hypothetical protein
MPEADKNLGSIVEVIQDESAASINKIRSLFVELAFPVTPPGDAGAAVPMEEFPAERYAAASSPHWSPVSSPVGDKSLLECRPSGCPADEVLSPGSRWYLGVVDSPREVEQNVRAFSQSK